MQVAQDNGLGQSMFTRIKNSFESSPNSPVLGLTEQYRMQAEICQWPNQYFYENRLVTHESTNEPAFPLRPYSILSIDSSQTKAYGCSKIWNESEAEFVVQLLLSLCKHASSEQYSYGVITPYGQQRTELSNKLE